MESSLLKINPNNLQLHLFQHMALSCLSFLMFLYNQLVLLENNNLKDISISRKHVNTFWSDSTSKWLRLAEML